MSLLNKITGRINDYHIKFEEYLPALSQNTKKIHRVHKDDHGQVLGQVEELFQKLKLELEAHIEAGNKTLLPLTKQYESNPSEELAKNIVDIVKGFEGSYNTIEETLRELKKVTSNYMDPREACYTCNLTLETLEELHSVVMEYINLEKEILTVGI